MLSYLNKPSRRAPGTQAKAPRSQAARRRPSGAALRAAVAVQLAAGKIALELQRLKGGTSDYNTIRRLGVVLATHGNNRALMSFANHRGAFSRFVRGLPATESLDLIPLAPSDARNLLSISGVRAALEQEADFVRGWLKTTTADIAALLKNAAEQINECKPCFKTLSEGLRGASVDEEELNSIEVTTVPLASRQTEIATLIEVLGLIAIPEYSAEDATWMDAFQKAMKDIADKLAPFTGATYDGMALSVDPDHVADAHRPVEATLAELGYTPAATAELIDQAAELAGVVCAKADMAAAIVERLEQIQTDIPAADTEIEPEGGEEQPESGEEPAAGGEDPAPTGGVEPEPEGGEPGEEPEGEKGTEDHVGGETSEEEESQALDAHRTALAGYVSLVSTAIATALTVISDVQAVADEVADLVMPEESDEDGTDADGGEPEAQDGEPAGDGGEPESGEVGGQEPMDD